MRGAELQARGSPTRLEESRRRSFAQLPLPHAAQGNEVDGGSRGIPSSVWLYTGLLSRGLAQLVEQRIPNPQVVGSSPPAPAERFEDEDMTTEEDIKDEPKTADDPADEGKQVDAEERAESTSLAVRSTGELSDVSSASDDAQAGEQGEEDDDEEGDYAGTPAQLGAQRFVYAAYFAGAVAIAFLLSKAFSFALDRGCRPLEARFGEPRTRSTMWYRRARRRRRRLLLRTATRRRGTLAEEVAGAVEGHLAEPRRRRELHLRRPRDTLVATAFFALMDRFWGFVTNLVYGGSLASRHGQEVVRHPDLLGVREQGQRGPPAAVKEHNKEAVFGEVLIPTETVGGSRRRQGARPPEDQLPRLHLRRDGDDRGGLAPRQGHPEGHRLHRQPAAAGGEAAADRRSPEDHRRGGRQAQAPRLLRGGRRDPRHRRRVRELLGHRRRGEARQAEAQGEGLHLRPRDAGRARLRSGREAGRQSLRDFSLFSCETHARRRPRPLRARAARAATS